MKSQSRFFFPNKLQFCSYSEHHQSVFVKILDVFCFFKVQIGIFILAKCVCLKVLDAPVMPNLSKFNLSNFEYDSWSSHSHHIAFFHPSIRTLFGGVYHTFRRLSWDDARALASSLQMRAEMTSLLTRGSSSGTTRISARTRNLWLEVVENHTWLVVCFPFSWEE